jgi:amino acid transporter
MAYLSMMIVVWNVINNLAEIVTYIPMKGACFVSVAMHLR